MNDIGTSVLFVSDVANSTIIDESGSGNLELHRIPYVTEEMKLDGTPSKNGWVLIDWIPNPWTSDGNWFERNDLLGYDETNPPTATINTNSLDEKFTLGDTMENLVSGYNQICMASSNYNYNPDTGETTGYFVIISKDTRDNLIENFWERQRRINNDLEPDPDIIDAYRIFGKYDYYLADLEGEITSDPEVRTVFKAADPDRPKWAITHVYPEGSKEWDFDGYLGPDRYGFFWGYNSCCEKWFQFYLAKHYKPGGHILYNEDGRWANSDSIIRNGASLWIRNSPLPIRSVPIQPESKPEPDTLPPEVALPIPRVVQSGTIVDENDRAIFEQNRIPFVTEDIKLDGTPSKNGWVLIDWIHASGNSSGWFSRSDYLGYDETNPPTATSNTTSLGERFTLGADMESIVPQYNEICIASSNYDGGNTGYFVIIHKITRDFMMDALKKSNGEFEHEIRIDGKYNYILADMGGDLTSDPEFKMTKNHIEYYPIGEPKWDPGRNHRDKYGFRLYNNLMELDENLPGQLQSLITLRRNWESYSTSSQIYRENSFDFYDTPDHPLKMYGASIWIRNNPASISYQIDKSSLFNSVAESEEIVSSVIDESKTGKLETHKIPFPKKQISEIKLDGTPSKNGWVLIDWISSDDKWFKRNDKLGYDETNPPTATTNTTSLNQRFTLGGTMESIVPGYNQIAFASNNYDGEQGWFIIIDKKTRDLIMEYEGNISGKYSYVLANIDSEITSDPETVIIRYGEVLYPPSGRLWTKRDDYGLSFRYRKKNLTPTFSKSYNDTPINTTAYMEGSAPGDNRIVYGGISLWIRNTNPNPNNKNTETCTCKNGTAATGSKCNGGEICLKCNKNYKLQDSKCVENTSSFTIIFIVVAVIVLILLVAIVAYLFFRPDTKNINVKSRNLLQAKSLEVPSPK